MLRATQLLIWVCLIFSFNHALASTARAGLLGPPRSYLRGILDGRYVLVFISPGPPDEDQGKTDKLPDGRVVNLRETFPVSGCYDSRSIKPLWTVPWEGYEYWAVSDDCRYLVRCNFASLRDFRGREDGNLRWGLKFYDRGKEIKSYGIADLVEFPSLLQLSDTSEYGYDWMDFPDGGLVIRDGTFCLQTRTHARFFLMWQLARLLSNGARGDWLSG